MATYKCDRCGEGEMIQELLPRYETKLGGIPFEVHDAQIRRCSRCGEISVNASELKRWKEAQRQHLEAAGCLLSAQAIQAIRESLQASVSDFAAVLSVTRQTVHGWEREDASPMQLGPTSLLLSALREELEGRLAGVWPSLLAAARHRGQEVSVAGAGLPRRHGKSGHASAPIRRRAGGSPTFSGKTAKAA